MLLFKAHVFNMIPDLMAFLYQKAAFFGKITADGCQADPVGGSVKQPGTDVCFEAADLLCHCTAGDKELFPGLSKTAGFRYCEEGFNLLQLQKIASFGSKVFLGTILT